MTARFWLIVAACLTLLAQPSRAESGPEGVWVGRYVCGQGETGLTLTIDSLMGGALQAQFRFYPTQKNPNVPEGCFTMAGAFDPTHRNIALTAKDWIVRPIGYVTVDLRGRLIGGGLDMRGAVAGPGCSTFTLHRVIAGTAQGAQTCRPSNVAQLMETQQ